ncbi:MAG: type II toxin-antitoxin system RelE/ParE family toxin [Planctomycetes bacterium]|nr:type II toxin-antitoxin system RelE/ParE family toxin [Planctomycetota bacterium]
MQKHKVIWSPSAEQDLEDIILYIDEENPINAQTIFEKIQNVTVNLELYPSKGKVIPELKAFGITSFQQIVLSPWRILYRQSNSTVYVMAVIDSRRDIEDILFNRITRESNSS